MISVKTVGTESNDCANGIIELADGGFAIAGYTEDPATFTQRGLVIKLDA